MRTLTAAVTAAVDSAHRADYVRVSVDKTGSGSWQDMTSFNGYNWLTSCDWQLSVDVPVATATVLLKREIENMSLATLMTLSKPNADTGSYVPVIQVWRRIKIEACTLAIEGVTPTGGTWNLVFDGYVDEVDPSSGTNITLKCRDLGALQNDTFIETERQYGSGAGVLVEYVMQDIIDDNNSFLSTVAANYTWNGTTTVTSADTSGVVVNDYIALNVTGSPNIGPFFIITAINPNVSVTITAGGRTIPTGSGAGNTKRIAAAYVVRLYTPSSPAWAVKQYVQSKEPILSAVNKLAQQIGWDVRYKWDSGTSTYRLTFYQPDRANTTPHKTFSKSQYYKVTQAAIGVQEIRNRVVIHYLSAAGVLSTVTAENSASQSKYGKRYMEITEAGTSHIDSSTEANLMAAAILSDLKEPTLDFGLEAMFCWFAELGDLYRFSDNQVFFDTNKDLAVTAIKHNATRDKVRTSFITRGVASGGVERWFDIEGRPGVAPTNARFTYAAPSNVVATIYGFTVIVTFDDPRLMTPPMLTWAYSAVYLSTSSGFTPGSANLQMKGKQNRFTISDQDPALVFYVKVIHYDEAGNASSTSAEVPVTNKHLYPAHLANATPAGHHWELNSSFQYQTKG